MFVDQAQITARAGDGGNGMVAFRREKYVPRGGPNGGDGGNGGSVWLVADPGRTTLTHFRHKRRFIAASGENGQPSNCHGRSAPDVVIPVPCGTLVYSDGALLGDLNEAGARLRAALGGRGGLGNQHFATPTRQAPRHAQRGERGEERLLDLQLKLLADAGLIGAPNAGKSTLLSSVSSARPKIGDYPFTTLEPQLGVVSVNADAVFVLVDLPGLIEGASKGAGLGDQFLRHVERTRVLVALIDGAVSSSEALAQLEMLERELGQWQAALLKKRRIVAVSKQDLPSARETLSALKARMSHHVFGVSGVTGHGLKTLMNATYSAICAAREEERHSAASADSAALLKPRPTKSKAAVSVVKEGRAFRILGEKLERLAMITDLASDDGRDYFHRVLARSGARRKLEQLGARAGDTVHVGATEFVF